MCAGQSFAQLGFDPGGDNLLNGTYYMRQVFYFVDGAGAITGTMNVQGTIMFSGTGVYTFTGSLLNSAATPPTSTFSTTGNYSISGNGEGFISNVNTSFSTDKIIGLVSHGVFIGSTTKTPYGYNDLFIAAPIGSTVQTNSTLNGTYTVAYFDPTVPGDALFSMTADGQGNIGAVNATEYLGASSSSTAQSLSGVTYSFSNGGANVKFGGTASSKTLIAGTKLLYVTPDGNFFFGGSYTGYEMFVGVKAATGPPANYAGLYYQAGLQMNESSQATGLGASVLNSYYGSFEAFSGQILGHESFGSSTPMKYRSLNALQIYGGSNDFTYYDTYTVNSDGSSDDGAFAQHYQSTADGAIRVGYGIGPFLSLNVAFQQPAYSGSGVYLNPAGIVNAGSSAPFTAQISPGEFVSLYGSGLAPSTASANVPFPNILNGVQVLINSVLAPISFVSPTQISIVVPYGLDIDLAAQVQVLNNGSSSNVVSVSTGSTSPGVFTNNPVGGIGYAAALHSDYSLVSQASPAQIGETVSLYLAGMGLVSLPVANGTAAPSSPLSITTTTPVVFLLDQSGNYKQAKVGFSGLAPGFAGLYQINVTVPSGLVTGDATLAVFGPDSATFEALFPVTTSGN